MPPVLVYAGKKDISVTAVSRQTKINAYVNTLRQTFVSSFKIENQCVDTLPFIVFDCDDEEELSRRLFRPVLPNMITNLQQSSSMRHANDHSPSLSAAGASIRQALSRSNQTLQQIREASNEIIPSPESQMSYKVLTPNGPPLPQDLQQSFTRSKQIV